MIDFQAVGDAFALLGSGWDHWIYIIPGLLLGMLFGAIPALSPAVGMAILLPATYHMDFLTAIVFLTSMFTGGGFATAIPSILVGVPGSPSAVATVFDGYPMTQKGQHNEALGLALGASTFAMLLSYVLLFLFIDPIARVAIRMGPSELLIIAIWGLSLVAMLNEKYMFRGLLSGLAGLLMGTIGMNNLGNIRGTMGIPDLLDGVPVIAAMIGLFAASEMFNLANKDYLIADKSGRKLNLGLMWRGVIDTLRHPVTLLRGSAIGALVGAVPGVGSTIASLLSYSETKRNALEPETFGQGNPEGVIAAEASNSSSEGGSLATLLALGVPGGGGTAILLAAFALHNVGTGPRFINDSKDLVYAIIFNNMVQGVALIVLGLMFIPLAAQIVRVPSRYIIPSVLSIGVLGAYTYTGSMFGPIMVGGFALLGWMMRRYGYSIPAMVIGLLLGRMAEGELVRTFQISGGHWSYVFDRPATGILLVLFVLSLTWPFVKRALRKRRARLQAES